MVLMGLRSWRVGDIVQSQLGINIKDRAVFFLRWLGDERQFHGMEGIKCTRFMEAIIREAYFLRCHKPSRRPQQGVRPIRLW